MATPVPMMASRTEALPMLRSTFAPPISAIFDIKPARLFLRSVISSRSRDWREFIRLHHPPRIAVAGRVGDECGNTACAVLMAGTVAAERINTAGGVRGAGC